MKEHKFFERFLNNDLTDFNSFILNKNQEMIDGEFTGITKEQAKFAIKSGSMATALSPYYNVFEIDNINIQNLYNEIKSMVQEACEYYEIDFSNEEYMIHGWFNIDGKSQANLAELHDHTPNTGAPFFHGYYCVNAEPSITNYHINKITMFDNANINNRAILSETGHPHRKGSWSADEKRITIAYEVVSLEMVNKTELSQMFIPLI